MNESLLDPETRARGQQVRREVLGPSHVQASYDVDALSLPKTQMAEYLRGISEVLVKAHESFAENVERTLREGNRQFQAELSGAVQLLSGAIKNLGDVIDDFSPRK